MTALAQFAGSFLAWCVIIAAAAGIVAASVWVSNTARRIRARLRPAHGVRARVVDALYPGDSLEQAWHWPTREEWR